MSDDLAPPSAADIAHPTFAAAARAWARVAALSFGGPAGQISVMHRILVDEKRWVSESRFLHALNYCMLLPGPEAQQLSIYIGWLLHGVRGGLVAGTLFVAPGFVAIMALSILYAGYHDLTWVEGLFYGLKPAVVAVVIQAVMRIGRRALKNRVMVAVAAAAFVAIFFLEIPFPLIILAAGVIGFLGGRVNPDTFAVIKPHQPAVGAATLAAPLIRDDAGAAVRPTLGRALRVLTVWLLVWLGPVAALLHCSGRDSVYSQQAVFFSKTAMVTFGGAYSVLAYVADEAVERYHWLEPGEMLDGLGMAETTPGPLIQVVQFVAFMGAYRHPGGLSPLAAGVAGSVIATWVTYAPCFLWIFLGAPYIEYLRGQRSLNAALSTITAAVVGVILNLSIWFAIHTLFAKVSEHRTGPVLWLVPEWSSLDPVALAITIAAMAALFRFSLGMLPTLAACAAAGLAYRLLAA
ncbi:chromate efflux transporter [Lacipirellula limnantheis]|uniref:Chromate transport protein n=1 Tax=Lacipirellula limnantheis TaxID=2528024 RepID=A0A517U3W8_9BACT|nr:chromate efflux transporter [Lacipirellula limnantheis]QDT75324.1 Chromate transport protein [Lacipirellula limnantheis]